MMIEIFKKKEKISDKDYRQLRRNRKIVLSVLAGTLLIIFGVIAYRDGRLVLRKFFRQLVAPRTIISSKEETTVTPTPAFAREKKEIADLVSPLKGNYGVFVQDLASGKSYGYNEDQVFDSASLNKLPLLLALYREAEAGNLDLETKYSLRVGDKRPGAGSLQYKPVGYSLTYRQMAELMGKQSDNTAFNVVSRILGEEKVQRLIDDLGLKKTSFVDWETTPADIGLFFYKLYTQNLLIRDDRDELLSFLTETIWEDRIPTGIPNGIRVAHKVGSEIGVVSDAGIVFAKKPFILAILSRGVLEKEAKEVLPKIAELVYKQFEK
ncbi:MAG TPA: class A beta-lactamase-related serine hydrolase [Candidatus Woesebacteria bacterium]|nr:class A beta-lactamase-related serine hydrolase [Candidatus Woesebacteria bacterium]